MRMHDARRQMMTSKVGTRLAITGILAAKVTPAQLQRFHLLVSLARPKSGSFTSMELAAIALSVFPEPRGRQQRRDTGFKMAALIERLYALWDCVGDPRLAKWTTSEADGHDTLANTLTILSAAARAPLRHSKITNKFSFDAGDLARLAEEGDR